MSLSLSLSHWLRLSSLPLSLRYFWSIPEEEFTCEPPLITRHTHKLWVLEGQRATLKCRAIGDPEPVIHWVSPDDRIIANSSRTSSFSNGTLDILVTVARDDGAYTCIAINAAGEATATVDLKIIPLPHRGGAGGNTGNNNVNTKSNRNVTNGILRTDPGSSDISTGKNGGINNGAGRGGEVEDGKKGGGEDDEGVTSRAPEGETADGGSMEDDEGEEEEGRLVGVQGVTSTSAQVRWDLGRLSTAYVVWMYQIQYNCTADETLIYRSVQLLLCNTHYSLTIGSQGEMLVLEQLRCLPEAIRYLLAVSASLHAATNHLSDCQCLPDSKGAYPVFMQNPLNIYPLQHDTSVVQLFTLYMDGWIAQGKDEWGDR